MIHTPNRREMISTLIALPFVGILSGCGDKTTKVVKIAKKLAVKIIKKATIWVDFAELFVEIKAIIDGDDVTETIYITADDAKKLKNGEKLSIKDSNGDECEVEYKIKEKK